MTSATDQALMFALAFLAAYIAHRLKERYFPSKSAEEMGYAPGSEDPPWGWPIAIALGIGVCGLLLFGPTMAARIIGL